MAHNGTCKNHTEIKEQILKYKNTFYMKNKRLNTRKLRYFFYILLTCVLCVECVNKKEEIIINVTHEMGYIDKTKAINNFYSIKCLHFNFTDTNKYLTTAYVIKFNYDSYYGEYADTSYKNICNVINEKKKLFMEYIDNEKKREMKNKLYQDSINKNIDYINVCVENAR